MPKGVLHTPQLGVVGAIVNAPESTELLLRDKDLTFPETSEPFPDDCDRRWRSRLDLRAFVGLKRKARVVGDRDIVAQHWRFCTICACISRTVETLCLFFKKNVKKV